MTVLLELSEPFLRDEANAASQPTPIELTVCKVEGIACTICTDDFLLGQQLVGHKAHPLHPGCYIQLRKNPIGVRCPSCKEIWDPKTLLPGTPQPVVPQVVVPVAPAPQPVVPQVVVPVAPAPQADVQEALVRRVVPVRAFSCSDMSLLSRAILSIATAAATVGLMYIGKWYFDS